MLPISAPVQSVVYAVLTKSIGSGFRVADDWNTTPLRRENTIKRETMLLGFATLVTTGVQMLFTKVLSSTLQKKPGLSQHELLLRALVTAPALIFAEWTSRQLAPKALPPTRTIILPPVSDAAIPATQPIRHQTHSHFSSFPPVMEVANAASNGPAIFYA